MRCLLWFFSSLLTFCSAQTPTTGQVPLPQVSTDMQWSAGFAPNFATYTWDDAGVTVYALNSSMAVTSFNILSGASRLWLPTSSGPPARGDSSGEVGATLAFLPQWQRLVLFGGLNGSGYLNDTWLFDPTSGQWAIVSGRGPSPRARAASAVDPQGALYIYGGSDSVGIYGTELWRLTVTGVGASSANASWALLWNGAQPPGRSQAGMVFSGQTLYLSMGLNAFTGRTTPLDLWAFNGTAWTPIALPSSVWGTRYASGAPFLSLWNRSLIIGPANTTAGGVQADMWSYNLGNGSATMLLSPSSGMTLQPTALGIASNQARAYLVQSAAIYYQQLGPGNCSAVTCPAGMLAKPSPVGAELNYATCCQPLTGSVITSASTLLWPTFTAGFSTSTAGYAWDDANATIYGYNGTAIYSFNILSGVWKLWTWTTSGPAIRQSNSTGGAMRFYDPGAVFVFAPQWQRLLLYGGWNGNASLFQDAWAYDPVASQWTSGTSLGPWRVYPAYVVDPQGSLYIFGGHNLSAVQDEMWCMNMTIAGSSFNNTWAQIKPNGRSPMARWFASMVLYGSKFLLYGGRSQSVSPEALMMFDPSSLVWTTVQSTAAVGPQTRVMLGAVPNLAMWTATGTLVVGPVADGSRVQADMWQWQLGPSGSSPTLLLSDSVTAAASALFVSQAQARAYLVQNAAVSYVQLGAASCATAVTCPGGMVPHPFPQSNDFNYATCCTYRTGQVTTDMSWSAGFTPASSSYAWDNSNVTVYAYNGSAVTMFNILSGAWRVWPGGSSPPPTQPGAVFVFLPLYQRCILFGGRLVNSSVLTLGPYVFDMAMSQWFPVNIVGSTVTPVSRYLSAAAADQTSNLHIFGGRASTTPPVPSLGDLWQLRIVSVGPNGVNATWLLEGPEASGGPQKRYSASMTISGTTLLLFGGMAAAGLGSGFSADLWAFNLQTQTWMSLNPTPWVARRTAGFSPNLAVWDATGLVLLGPGGGTSSLSSLASSSTRDVWQLFGNVGTKLFDEKYGTIFNTSLASLTINVSAMFLSQGQGRAYLFQESKVLYIQLGAATCASAVTCPSGWVLNPFPVGTELNYATCCVATTTTTSSTVSTTSATTTTSSTVSTTSSSTTTSMSSTGSTWTATTTSSSTTSTASSAESTSTATAILPQQALQAAAQLLQTETPKTVQDTQNVLNQVDVLFKVSAAANSSIFAGPGPQPLRQLAGAMEGLMRKFTSLVLGSNTSQVSQISVVTVQSAAVVMTAAAVPIQNSFVASQAVLLPESLPLPWGFSLSALRAAVQAAAGAVNFGISYSRWRSFNPFGPAVIGGQVLDPIGDVISLSVTDTQGVPIPLQGLVQPLVIAVPVRGMSYEDFEAAFMQQTHPACRFWNATSGEWSGDGCRAIGLAQSGNTLLCACTHLTTFGAFSGTDLLLRWLTEIIAIFDWRLTCTYASVLSQQGMLNLTANLWITRPTAIVFFVFLALMCALWVVLTGWDFAAAKKFPPLLRQVETPRRAPCAPCTVPLVDRWRRLRSSVTELRLWLCRGSGLRKSFVVRNIQALAAARLGVDPLTLKTLCAYEEASNRNAGDIEVCKVPVEFVIALRIELGHVNGGSALNLVEESLTAAKSDTRKVLKLFLAFHPVRLIVTRSLHQRHSSRLLLLLLKCNCALFMSALFFTNQGSGAVGADSDQSCDEPDSAGKVIGTIMVFLLTFIGSEGPSRLLARLDDSLPLTQKTIELPPALVGLRVALLNLVSLGVNSFYLLFIASFIANVLEAVVQRWVLLNFLTMFLSVFLATPMLWAIGAALMAVLDSCLDERQRGRIAPAPHTSRHEASSPVAVVPEASAAGSSTFAAVVPTRAPLAAATQASTIPQKAHPLQTPVKDALSSSPAAQGSGSLQDSTGSPKGTGARDVDFDLLLDQLAVQPAGSARQENQRGVEIDQLLHDIA